MWELQLHFRKNLVRVLFCGNYPDAIANFYDFAIILGSKEFQNKNVVVHPFIFYEIGQENFLYLTKITPKEEKSDPNDFVELDDN